MYFAPLVHNAVCVGDVLRFASHAAIKLSRTMSGSFVVTGGATADSVLNPQLAAGNFSWSPYWASTITDVNLTATAERVWLRVEDEWGLMTEVEVPCEEVGDKSGTSTLK